VLCWPKCTSTHRRQELDLTGWSEASCQWRTRLNASSTQIHNQLFRLNLFQCCSNFLHTFSPPIRMSLKWEFGMRKRVFGQLSTSKVLNSTEQRESLCSKLESSGQSHTCNQKCLICHLTLGTWDALVKIRHSCLSLPKEVFLSTLRLDLLRLRLLKWMLQSLNILSTKSCTPVFCCKNSKNVELT